MMQDVFLLYFGRTELSTFTILCSMSIHCFIALCVLMPKEDLRMFLTQSSLDLSGANIFSQVTDYALTLL